MGNGLSAGESAWLSQLAENAAYRTNISLINTGDTEVCVTVRLHDGFGTQVGRCQVVLAPGE